MSPQPQQSTNGRQAELKDLFERGATLREAARQARATARELREMSLVHAKQASGGTAAQD